MAWHAHRLLFIEKNTQNSATRDWPPPRPRTRQLRRSLLSPHRAIGHTTTPHLPPIAQHPRTHHPIDPAATRTSGRSNITTSAFSKNDRFFHPGDPGAWGTMHAHLAHGCSAISTATSTASDAWQYKIGPFRQKMRAYRHRTSAHLCLLCETGLEFRTDGQLQRRGADEKIQRAWTSKRTETSTHISGNPIPPQRPRTNASPSASHALTGICVLTEGDPILEIQHPRRPDQWHFENCGRLPPPESLNSSPNTSPTVPSKRSVAHPGCSTPRTSTYSPKIPTSPASSANAISSPLNSRSKYSSLDRIFGPLLSTTSPQPHATAA